MDARLAKAFDMASASLYEAVSNRDVLSKGSSDAMAHHAIHAQAARHADKLGDAKQHEFMMLRHALEHAKNQGQYSDASLSHSLRRNMDHHSAVAADSVGHWHSNRNSEHPAVKHFKSGKGFVAHPHDSQFKDSPKASKK